MTWLFYYYSFLFIALYLFISSTYSGIFLQQLSNSNSYKINPLSQFLNCFTTLHHFFFSIYPSDKNLVWISPSWNINSFFFKSIIHYLNTKITLNLFIMSRPNKNSTLLFSITVNAQVKNFPSISMSAA